MTETPLSKLLEVKSRYEHAVEMARECACTCNSARNPSVVNLEIVEYLLEDDAANDVLAEIPVGQRSRHCPVHSPPVSECPWVAGTRAVVVP